MGHAGIKQKPFLDNKNLFYKNQLILQYCKNETFFCIYLGIQLGGLGAMAPERKQDLAQVVFRAFVAGCFTSFINACMAGALISTTSTV